MGETAGSESPEQEAEPVEADIGEAARVPWKEKERTPLTEEVEPQEAQEAIPEYPGPDVHEAEEEPAEPIPPWVQEAGETASMEPDERREAVEAEEQPEPLSSFPAPEEVEAPPAEGVNFESLFQEPVALEDDEKAEGAGGLPTWLLEETLGQEGEGEGGLIPGEGGMPVSEAEDLPPWLVEEETEDVEEGKAVGAPDEDISLPFTFEEEAEARLGEPESATVEMREEEPAFGVDAEVSPEERGEGPTFGEMALDEQALASLLDEAALPAEADQEVLAEDLAPGEIPDWLSALRPEEEEEPETASPVAEGELAGPLAGIPDVLPMEARLTEMVQREGRFVLKLLVRKEEQQWARWLQHWIRQEEAREGTEGVGVSRPMPYWLWRVVVGLLLLFALGLLLVFGPQDQVSSPSPSRGAQAFVTLAQALPERAVVLLAVDYHPAWAPEVSQSARTALRLLEVRTPYYLVVTTQPYGLTLAQRLLQEAGVPPERYILLGYLPGDRIALALMARWPRAAFPPPVQGKSPWDQPGLASWTGLENTALVLVLTDQATRARDWIEQLTPYLPKNTALAFAGSLQIVPVLEPYFDTQVRGWIGGLMDAAALAYQTQASIPLNLWMAWSVSWPLGLFLGVLSAATLAVVKRIRQGEAP